MDVHRPCVPACSQAGHLTSFSSGVRTPDLLNHLGHPWPEPPSLGIPLHFYVRYLSLDKKDKRSFSDWISQWELFALESTSINANWEQSWECRPESCTRMNFQWANFCWSCKNSVVQGRNTTINDFPKECAQTSGFFFFSLASYLPRNTHFFYLVKSLKSLWGRQEGILAPTT